jgi:hypothetical protein
MGSRGENVCVSAYLPLTLASTQTVQPYACLYQQIELFIDSAIVIRDVGVDSRSGVRSRLDLGLGHFAAFSGSRGYLNAQLKHFLTSRASGMIVTFTLTLHPDGNACRMWRIGEGDCCIRESVGAHLSVVNCTLNNLNAFTFYVHRRAAIVFRVIRIPR